ncbi:hypothetical protein GKZ89_07510 [Bacillus mangrovi]|uniref:Uncharacterized protein n=1 Tax=Metabacillus mangrovi TaxID=1491830 RepID=A0A7X2S4U0_9BACI|nr:hypothetical protein [Metabacillus mangrovi]MTH53258.1 hypothetical protein [Metabacillus mangrovi]
MKQAAVLGAHTCLGFALCKEWMERGYSVLAVFEAPSNPFEERRQEEMMMTVGRNALFHPARGNEEPDLAGCDFAVCGTGWLENFQAQDLPQILLAADETQNADSGKTIIYTGPVYGPWQYPGEELINWAKTGFAAVPFRDDPGVFAEDAAKTIADLTDSKPFGKTYYLPGNAAGGEQLTPLSRKTPIAQALKELKLHMEQYPFLYDSSALV